MIFFTSDTHFGHANIIRYCGRPFKNTQEMDREMIRRWNARVGPSDTVYHLGDFSFGSRPFAASLLSRLNGRKILIRGNHDPSKARMLDVGFDEVFEDLLLGGQQIGRRLYLNHKPEVDFKDRLSTAMPELHLCGHVHQAWARRGDVINVGVDVRGFEPRTLDELLGSTGS